MTKAAARPGQSKTDKNSISTLENLAGAVKDHSGEFYLCVEALCSLSLL